MSLLPDHHAPFPPLDPADFAPDPMTQFAEWFAIAEREGVASPDTAALATATPDGVPSLRMVLVKGAGTHGFRIFTNYRSRKGRELDANPRAALAFYWQRIGRQVRAEGTVSRVPERESDLYFETRPPGSRLSAAASPQSEVIADRAEIERRLAALQALHPDGSIPRPAEWGGYRLEPESVEFWQHGAHRLHDRLRYRRDGLRWRLERLAP